MSRGKLLNTNLTALFDVIRPIGSLYSTIDSTFNPNTASGWHGTWERITDCVIYASGDSDTVGQIVGSNTHSITVNEMPSHDHTIPALSGKTNKTGSHAHWSGDAWTAQAGNVAVRLANYTTPEYHSSTGSAGEHEHTVTTNASTTGSKGSGTAMDLRSRRINAIVWKRTA